MKIAVAVTLAALFAAPLAHADGPAGSAVNGKALFMKNMCYTCHGTVGQGGERGAGPKLAPNPFPFAAFEMQLRTPRGVMPRFPKQFVSDRELADIYQYVASIPAGKPASEIALLKGR
ncbi:MAG TPA: cytochrome c [Telluria sp.]|nr:cytochrome c [Telluria sp.]